MKGAASICITSQPNVKSWNNLKAVLNFEFEKKLSALDIHKAMKNRKKKPNESFREYLYSLQEIASPIELDEESIIEYFIDGIPDSRVNKLVLYEASTLFQLKDKLRVYEKVHPIGKTSSYSPSSS